MTTPKKRKTDAQAWAKRCGTDIARLTRAARDVGWKITHCWDDYRESFHFGPVWLEVSNYGIWKAGVVTVQNYAVDFTAAAALRETWARCDAGSREMLRPVYLASGLLPADDPDGAAKGTTTTRSTP